MVKNEKNFNECPVIIFDGGSNIISKSVITHHDKSNLRVEISERLNNVKPGSRINLLILHPGGASKFDGVARGISKYKSEISLFHEHERGVRGSDRLVINTPAVVENVVIRGKRKPVDPPQRVLVENISLTGVLIKSAPTDFEVGSMLDIHLNLSGNNVTLCCEIIWSRIYDDENIFGCRFNFAQESEVA